VLKEVVKWIDACYELSAQHARFISVSHSGGATSAHVDQRIPQIKVMELHAKLALKLNDQSLVAVIQVSSLRSSSCVLQHSNMCVHSTRSERCSCTWDQPRRIRVHGCTLLGQFAKAHCRYERFVPTRGKQKSDTLIRFAAAMEALTTCLHINTNARSINYVTCSYDSSSPLLCPTLALTYARSP
jgi:hypothetical protein